MAQPKYFVCAETVAVDDKGRMYMPDEHGLVWTAETADSAPEHFVYVGGRPLGMAIDAGGNLIICDALKVR